MDATYFSLIDFLKLANAPVIAVVVGLLLVCIGALSILLFKSKFKDILDKFESGQKDGDLLKRRVEEMQRDIDVIRRENQLIQSENETMKVRAENMKEQLDRLGAMQVKMFDKMDVQYYAIMKRLDSVK